MAEFSISYNGRHYQYDRYRYDHFADAVDYARLQRSRLPAGEESAPAPPAELMEAPDESQRQQMTALANRAQTEAGSGALAKERRPSCRSRSS